LKAEIAAAGTVAQTGRRCSARLLRFKLKDDKKNADLDRKSEQFFQRHGLIEVHDGSHNLSASIADKNIEPPECFDGLHGASLDLFFAGYIHRYADNSCRSGRFPSRLRRLWAQNGHYLFADPAPGTGDDGNFVF